MIPVFIFLFTGPVVLSVVLVRLGKEAASSGSEIMKEPE